MDHSKYYCPAGTAFLILAAALYICVWSPSTSNPFLDNYNQQNNCHCSNVTTSVKDELELALSKASMPNKTVIIAVVNKAYVEKTVVEKATMLDLFLESFWLGEDTRPLLHHLLLVAVDQTAYLRCQFQRLHCYRLVTEGVDFEGEKVFMSDDFVKMMWRRTLLLLDVLNRGYNFIFTDMDVMWLRNPFMKLSPTESVDLQISVDTFNNDPRPEHNFVNTGFYYIRSNNKTISLLDTWYSQKDHSAGRKEQDVLQDLMHGGLFQRLNLTVKFLETRHFSGFCQDSQDITAVTTVHANCCRLIKAKFTDLAAVLRDWKQFKTVVKEHTEVAGKIIGDFKWAPHTECWNSWK